MTNTPQIGFSAYQATALSAGEYQIEASLTLTGPDSSTALTSPDSPDEQSGSVTISFSVAGPRFQLSSDDIVSVFPPASDTGFNADVLPMVVFSRPTLPWERSPLELASSTTSASYEIYPTPVSTAASSADAPHSWLALLVFDQENAPIVQNGTVNDLISADGILLPDLTELPDSPSSIPIQYIDLPIADLSGQMPEWDDLLYNAHVRELTNGEEAPENYSVVVASRFPQADGGSIAYLVSVEGYYATNDSNTARIDATSQDQFRLLCLHQWNFASLQPDASFSTCMQNIAANGPFYLQPEPPPQLSNDTLNTLYSSGRQPFSQPLSSSETTLSWYQGPLVPVAPNWATSPLATNAITQANQLYLQDQDTGMLDVTYAAAWQLGQLMMLRQKSLCLSLYSWKQTNLQYLQADPYVTTNQWPTSAASKKDWPTAPETLISWLVGLAQMHNVPFQYLVPTESMLPAESMRFFQIDPYWQQALLLGALSIGAVPLQQAPIEYLIEQVLALAANQTLETASSVTTLSGVLIRSEAIEFWPNMVITAQGGDSTPTLLTRTQLGNDIEMLLFAGEVSALSCHPHLRGIYAGANSISQAQASFSRSSGDVLVSLNDGNFQFSTLYNAFAQNQSNYNAAQFALDLIRPTDYFQFSLAPSTSALSTPTQGASS